MRQRDPYLELKYIYKVYSVGIEVLKKIKTALEKHVSDYGIIFEDLDENEGELLFWFAGICLYAKIVVISGKTDYFGRIAWGRFTIEAEEIIRQEPVAENVYEQKNKEKFWLFYKEGKVKMVYDFKDDLPELLFNNIWKAIKDQFPETDEELPQNIREIYNSLK